MWMGKTIYKINSFNLVYDSTSRNINGKKNSNEIDRTEPPRGQKAHEKLYKI